MDVVLDGERVVKLKPVFGYLHRNHEKLLSRRRTSARCRIRTGWIILARLPITGPTRSLSKRWRVCGAGTRRVYSRDYSGADAVAESRVDDWFLTQEMGASGSPLMYSFREREKILDLFESLTGSRMMCNYMRFGGCRVDLPAGWLEQARKVVAEFPRFLDEFERLLADNEILLARTQGVGVLSRSLQFKAGSRDDPACVWR